MENSTTPHFFKEVRERSKMQFSPFNDLYLTYIFFFILFIGGAGIWISLVKELMSESFNARNFTLNIGTYYLALISTSYIDITTNEKIVNKKSLQVYSFILLFIIIGIFSLTFLLSSGFSILLSTIGILIALFIWHIANCDNEKFNDVSYNAKIRSEVKEIHGNNWNK